MCLCLRYTFRQLSAEGKLLLRSNISKRRAKLNKILNLSICAPVSKIISRKGDFAIILKSFTTRALFLDSVDTWFLSFVATQGVVKEVSY